MLEHEYFYDSLKFYTAMAEFNPKFMAENQPKMGLAALASLASTVVAKG